MHIPEPTGPMMSYGRRAIALPRHGAAVLAAILATGLAVGGCGGSGSASTSASATILNTHKVERAIERSALAQRGEHAIVSCPSRVDQKQGISFSCTAKVGETSTRFVVNQLDGSGDVHYAAR